MASESELVMPVLLAPVVESAHVGGAPKDLTEKRTIEWHIHDFEDLKHKNGKMMKLPPLRCHGISWDLRVCPRGYDGDSEGWVSVFVYTADYPPDRDLWVKYTIRAEGDLGIIVRNTPDPLKLTRARASGYQQYIKRNELSDFLVDGTLTLQVELQVNEDRALQPWTPRKTIGADMRKVLESGTFSDVTFVAGGKSFPAHRALLRFRAPTLFELCEDAPPNSDVPLDGVSASIFGTLLSYVYTDEPPGPEVLSGDARELLEAADRFGCAGLKLLAESELVKSGVDAGNVVSLLLLADARSCALLKEAAMNRIASDPAAAMASEDWELVKESNGLLVEIMEAAFGARRKKGTTSGNDAGSECEYDDMNVTSLRRKLDDAGLSGDGTREMLVKRLKVHHNEST